MSHDGRPVRAASGARATEPDRRARVMAIAGLGLGLTLALAACGTSNNGGVAGATGTPAASDLPSASAEASASAAASNGLNQGFLTFQDENSSKIFGGGTVTDLGDGSSAVTIGIVAVGFTDPLPARLVTGSCADAATAPLPSFAPPPSEAAGSAAPASVAPSVAPSVAASAGASAATGSVAPTRATLPIELTPVAGGGSNTVIQLALADLLASPSSVLVYKSAADPSLVACSDVSPTLVLPSSAPAASAPAASASELPMASGSTAP
jgi:hypothetical protein